MTNKEIIESTAKNPFPEVVLIDLCLEDSIFYNLDPELKDRGITYEDYQEKPSKKDKVNINGIARPRGYKKNYNGEELWKRLGLI
jgi:spore coat polysaccharide biosynthesis predicted glycosyltransferase SpsG